MIQTKVKCPKCGNKMILLKCEDTDILDTYRLIYFCDNCIKIFVSLFRFEEILLKDANKNSK